MQAHVEVCGMFTQILFILKEEVRGEWKGPRQKIYLSYSYEIIERLESAPWTTLCLCTHKQDYFETIILK